MSIYRTVLIAGMLMAASVANSQTLFTASQSGANEVPPTGSTGWGKGTFVLSADQDSLYYSLVWIVNGSYVASHIHAAPAGVNGGVVHALLNANSTGALGSWAIDALNLSRLLNDSLYVNVHTTTFPGGEIRSQILNVPFPDTTTYTAAMSGTNEVPPTPSTGWGLGTFVLSSDWDSLYYSVMWVLNGTFAAAHIHAAPAGVNGGVVHPLLNAGTVGAHGTWAIDAANLSRLLHDSLYVNAHTTLWPGGEIRGQIYLNAPASAPPPITDLVIMPQPADSGLHLFWSPSAGASQYNIYLSSNSDSVFEAPHFFTSVADTHYLHVGAISDPALKRFYGVTAESSARSAQR